MEMGSDGVRMGARSCPHIHRNSHPLPPHPHPPLPPPVFEQEGWVDTNGIHFILPTLAVQQIAATADIDRRRIG